MAAPPPAPLATVTRRDVVTGREVPESHHVGHLVVLGPDGAVAGVLGDADRPTFVRSAAKPFQATACLELLDGAGAPPTAQPSPVEVAIAWASHRAEPEHVATVARLLARSGTDQQELTCPPVAGEHDPAAGEARIHSDCSGKHALFALTGQHLGLGRAQLLDPDGPLQRVVLRVVADAIGPALATGTDGCGAPAVAVPLHGLARGFRALAGEDRWARVRRAGLQHPHAVGGRDRLETALLGLGTIAKSGAEGVFAAGWCDDDGGAWGLAGKVEDGGARGIRAAVAALLHRLDRLPAGAWSEAPILGGGRPAGTVTASDAVDELAGALVVAGGDAAGSGTG